jgi:hypothetical protein
VGEILDALVNVVHSQADTSFTFELEHLHSFLLAFVVLEDNLEGAWPVDCEVCGLVLVTEGVSTDDDGLFPAGDQAWDVVYDDGFSEDCSVQDVSDCSIWTFPHLLQVEFLDSGFIGSDGGAFDTYFAFFDGISCVDCDLIVGSVSVFHAQVEVIDIEVQEGEDEFVLDGFPDDSGHFITVKFCNWVLYFNFFKLHRKRYFINEYLNFLFAIDKFLI